MVGTVSLIGMPGAGKSTVGVLLAKRLGLDFVDGDIAIQVAEGRTLALILEDEGHEALRAIEERVLVALELEGRLVATGGSAVDGDGAMERLRAAGPVLYLEAPLETLTMRVGDLRGRGIAAPTGSTLSDVYAERVPLYERWATASLDATRSPEENVVAALDQLAEEAIR